MILPLLLVALVALAMVAGCATGRCGGIETFGNVGPTVNSPYDEYAPVPTDTAMLIFTSNRVESGRGGLRDQYEPVRPTRLYFSMRLEREWDAPRAYTILEGLEREDAATLAVAPPGSPFRTIAYVGICGRSGGVGGCDLFAVIGGEKGGYVDLGAAVNSPAWDGQPYVTPDAQHLYFASDRPGGFGGTDIWISDRLPSGAWDTPRNAGPAVNTTGDELSPFFDARSGKLYFAAKTDSAGFDIFTSSAGAAGRERLPRPYNSESDDFTPYVLGATLYLASNRPGGCGGYDLYAFPL